MINKKLINQSLVFFSLSLTSCFSAHATLDQEMDKMFDDMLVNVTPSGSYETAARGGFQGGRITLRNKMSAAPKLLLFDPPRFSSGCGGIDMYGGSFSFISKDALQNYMRNVASNASTYAFGLALEAMCPTCKQNIDELRNLTNDWNKNLSDSCKFARSTIDKTGLKKIRDDAKAKGESILPDLGIVDAFEAVFPDSGTSPEVTLKTAAPAEAAKIEGNVLWKILKNNDVASWYAAGGDDEMLMTIMSIFGTIVISPVDVTIPDSTNQITPYAGGQVTLHDLVAGVTVKQWQCDEPIDCLAPTEATAAITSAETRIEQILNGTAGNIGLISKFRYGAGQTFTAEEISFLENAPDIVGVMLRNLTVDPGLAETTLAEVTHILAIDIAYNMVVDIHTEVLNAIKSDTTVTVPQETLDDYGKILVKYKTEHQVLLKKAKAPGEFLDLYNNARAVLKPKTPLESLLARTKK